MAINLTVHDVDALLQHAESLVPGQKMYVENDAVIYHTVERGVTRKGIPWVNVHKSYRENAMYSIRDRALPYLVGRGLDAGCGIEKVTPDCIGIDSGMDYEGKTDADDIRDASDLAGYADGQFDWVFSSNALEHIGNWAQALSEWCRVVKKGGIIFLYLPWPEKCPVHSPERTPHHLWSPSPAVLVRELRERGFSTEDFDMEPDRWGCFVIIGRKR
jgi:SAM-dependent methyltransferase